MNASPHQELESTTSQDTQPPDETDRRFSLRHALAILFAIGVTGLLACFREQLIEFQHFAYPGAFLIMLFSNATIILPVPGLLFIFGLGSSLNPFLVGLVAGAGGALGEMTGYLAGYGSSALIDNFKLYKRIEGWMRRHGLLTIAVLAAVPNPAFDTAGLAAGALRMRWWHFLSAAWFGKTIQAVLIAYAGRLSLEWILRLLG